MKTYRSMCGVVARVIGFTVAASVPLGLSSTIGNAVEPVAAPTSVPHPPAAVRQSDIEARKTWHEQMDRLPLPKNGCFSAAYPAVEWRRVECVRPSPYRNTVGAGADYTAQSTGNYISSATGTFVNPPSTAGTENGLVFKKPPLVSNIFTLQMNSQSPFNNNDGSNFTPPLCGNTPQCSAWEQFVFSQTQGPAPDPAKGQQSAAPNASPPNTPGLFIEYWLYNAGPTCPALPPWALNGQPPGTPWSGGGGVCVFNSPMTYVNPLTTADLPGLTMTANADASGETVVLKWSGGMAVYSASTSVLNLSQYWTETEFNVFGDGGSTEANFTSPTNLVVNIALADNFVSAPNCGAMDGTTGETNNLILSGTTTAIPMQSEGTIQFTENNTGATPATCSHSIGDTHLETLDGLFYDFQAAGDFVLAQADPDFVVQTRQVSGAPSWPLADLNHAVATQMGKSRVAICVLPTRLFVDGKPTDLGDGKKLSLPDGVEVYRGGNTYAVMREGGDIMHAQINSNSANTWINVTVGVAHSATRNARGLLANPGGKVDRLAARDGKVFAAPVAFSDLYHPYADSWRVQSKETLLSPCGDRNIETGVAAKAFYANDLEPKLAERARTVCTAKGVKEGPQLDACMIDTTVLGDEKAANVFTRALPIRAVLRPDLPIKRIEIKPIIRRP